MSDALRAAALQALEALEYHREQTRPIESTSKAILALRHALGMHPVRPRGKSHSVIACLEMVLASPKPLKVLCVFGTFEAMMAKFRECANHAVCLTDKVKVRHTSNVIETPIGSMMMFYHVASQKEVNRCHGLEVHDVWVDESVPMKATVQSLLECRVRL